MSEFAVSHTINPISQLPRDVLDSVNAANDGAEPPLRMHGQTDGEGDSSTPNKLLSQSGPRPIVEAADSGAGKRCAGDLAEAGETESPPGDTRVQDMQGQDPPSHQHATPLPPFSEYMTPRVIISLISITFYFYPGACAACRMNRSTEIGAERSAH